MEEQDFTRKDLGWRPGFSIVVGVAWLVFLIIWFAFYASNMAHWEQNIAIVLASILIAFGILGGTWCIWAIRKIPKPGREMMNIGGFKWRAIISMIAFLAATIFLIIWFWFTGGTYEIWHHIAVILVTILVVGGILGVSWVGWGMKYGQKFEKYCGPDKEAAFYHHKKTDEEEETEEPKED